MALPQPVSAIYLASAPVRVSLPAPAATGDYDLRVRVAGIDGEANASGGEAAARPALRMVLFATEKTLCLRNTPAPTADTARAARWAWRRWRLLKGRDFVGVSYHHVPTS